MPTNYLTSNTKPKLGRIASLACGAVLVVAGIASAEAASANNLHLKLTNSDKDVPVAFEIHKWGPLENNGSRQDLGIVPCGNSVIESLGKRRCEVSVGPGHRVEIIQRVEGRRVVVQSFDLPNRKKYFSKFEFGTTVAPVNVDVEAVAKEVLTEQDTKENLTRMAQTLHMTEGWRPQPVGTADRFLGRFVVAKVNDAGEPINVDQSVWDVRIELDPTKDLPRPELITLNRYTDNFLLSRQAHAQMGAKVPAIASFALDLSASDFAETKFSVRWYNFRITPTIAEAVAQLSVEDRHALLEALKLNPDARLFFINGMTVVETFDYSYKEARQVGVDSKVEFVAGGVGFSFANTNEKNGASSLDKQIVAVAWQALGGHAQISQAFSLITAPRHDRRTNGLIVTDPSAEQIQDVIQVLELDREDSGSKDVPLALPM